MKSNFIRLGILGILIILCIWQTTLLWLGDASSHNFLDNTASDIVTQPKEIWVNKNGLAYKIDGDNDGSRLDLLVELSNTIKKGKYQLVATDKTTYEELLSRQGFVYEYGAQLSIDEILGFTVNRGSSTKELGKIIELFIDISEGDQYRSYIYLINKSQKVVAMLSLEGSLVLHNKTIQHYNDENKTTGMKTYQASLLNTNQASLLNINSSKAFERNIFYPQNNKNMPITYKEIYLRPVINGNTIEEKVMDLENYVDSFFKNPLYKQYSITSKGIIFSDSLNLNIRYSDQGVLEFKRHVTEETIKLSAVEKMNKVNRFIEETEAIPKGLKKGLYLKEVEESEDSGETIYRFGYRFEGFEVLLTDYAKEQLKTQNFLELAIKSNQVVRGNWLMFEVDVNENEYIKDAKLTREGYVAIRDTQKLCKIENLDEDPLGYIQCAYIIQNIQVKADFDWAATYQDKWYYP